ncbi:MAG: CCA tRNA nucleotidyltransferase [Acidimicrobiia bacterium]|nr:CCA tRNA nucleotidyltransferase [Acidimicrobiia bacterium]
MTSRSNTMALALPGGRSVVDPHGGAVDLAAGRLRTPLSPDESFSDDPLRMMRAARFIAGYGLEPDPDLVESVRRLHHRLEIVSAERIRDELDKLIVVDDPSVGLWFLVDTGLADEFLPELPAMRLEQDPIHHHKDVLAHTFAVVAKVRATTDEGPNRITRLPALLHDVGKPATRSIGGTWCVASTTTRWSAPAHGTRTGCRELQVLERATSRRSRTLVYLHLRFHTYGMGWTDSAVRRFVRDAGPLLDELIELTRCDCTTRNRRKAAALARRMDELEARIAELREQEELARIRPDLDGRQVMDHLGVEPGPVVGEALDHLLELRLEEGPLTEQQAYDRLDRWWAERRMSTD